MTIAISLKVNDGLVLAADSAATLPIFDESGNIAGVSAVYNNANKIFNLRKGLPIGVVTWGLGGIGYASTATLMKDLRARFSGEDKAHAEWALIPDAYSIEQVAQKLRQFVYEELYVPFFQGRAPMNQPMGFIVGGYSAGEGMAEEFQVQIAPDGTCADPSILHPKEEAGGISWNGEPEAIHRLLLGYGSGLADTLQSNLGVPPEQVAQVTELIQQNLQVQVITPAMPIQDAIDLAEFLAEMTARFSRFTPGAATVGGPIEVAAITKHEGFKWIRRKYYYKRELNPEEVR